MLVKLGFLPKSHTWAWPVLFFEGGGYLLLPRILGEFNVWLLAGKTIVSGHRSGGLTHRHFLSCGRSGCGQELSFPWLLASSMSMSSCDCPCLTGCIQVSLARKNTRQVGLVSTLATSFWLNHLLKDSSHTAIVMFSIWVSPKGSCWTLRQHMAVLFRDVMKISEDGAQGNELGSEALTLKLLPGHNLFLSLFHTTGSGGCLVIEWCI